MRAVRREGRGVRNEKLTQSSHFSLLFPLSSLAFSLFSFCCVKIPFTMNLLLTNANIYTVDPRNPRATAIAIANDRIVAVGSEAELEGVRLPNLQRIDLGGAFVLPGLIDSHLHLQHTAMAMLSVDLDEVPTLEEAIRRVCAHAVAAPKGEWITGWGWQQAI